MNRGKLAMRPYRSVLPAFQAAGRPLWPLIGITSGARVVAACGLIVYGASQSIALTSIVAAEGGSADHLQYLQAEE